MTQIKRCSWCGDDPLYTEYHDTEWGVPVHDDRMQFEFLVLEGAQAGLSWLTILRRRENYRKAFANFDPVKVARFNQRKIASLLKNEGIIRNKAKIRAAVTNAQAFLEIQEAFGTFDTYIWSFVDGKPKQNKWKRLDQIPTQTKASEKLSKDLKARGFKFVGPVIIYAHMQAAGMVNDHLVDCFRYKEIQRL
ncbi:MAG: DNA-3-methyladenine glycosylase I [Deltaproteobacteria bacterium]|nr:DNA-3-methyladenine glycosylase I [Deltaproteobacteria bacterium]